MWLLGYRSWFARALRNRYRPCVRHKISCQSHNPLPRCCATSAIDVQQYSGHLRICEWHVAAVACCSRLAVALWRRLAHDSETAIGSG